MISPLLLAAAVLFTGDPPEQGFQWGSKTPYSGIKLLKNGSYEESVYRPQQRTLTKTLKKADFSLLSTSIFRLSKGGMPLLSETFDASGRRILKSRFGYRKSDGKLIEEQVFDTVNPRKDANGQEIPVRRIIFD